MALTDPMNTLSSRSALEHRQLDRLGEMLQLALPANAFYRKKFSAREFSDIVSMETLKSLPLTKKSELVENQVLYPPFWDRVNLPGGALHQNPSDVRHDGQTAILAGHRKIMGLVGGMLESYLFGCRSSAWGSHLFCFFFRSIYRLLGGLGGARKLGALAISGGGQSTAQRFKTLFD